VAAPFRAVSPDEGSAEAPPKGGTRLSVLLLAGGGLALFGWILSLGFTTLTPHTDFRFHVRLARQLTEGAPLTVPHPLFHWLTIAVHALAPGMGFAAAGFAIALLGQVALLVLLDLRLVRSLARPSVRAYVVAVVVTLALCFVGPLNTLTPAPREFYFGYVFPNTFHNPTNLLLRPLALGLFGLCVTLVAGRPRAATLGGALALTVASALAKPSHLICLLPALVVVALLAGLGEAWPRLGRIALGVILPAVAILAWQAWLTWMSGTMEPASVVWAPLEVVFSLTARNVPLLALKVLLSIVFPLVVLAVYGGQARRDPSLRLAWISFLFGLVYAYGLAETESRFNNGNFLWSAQITLFLVFVASAEFLLRRAPRAETWRWAACAVAFALHLASGLAYALHFARTGQAY
jgi:hypothetical protein